MSESGGIEILEVMDELRDMPEYHLYINLQELNNSIYDSPEKTLKLKGQSRLKATSEA